MIQNGHRHEIANESFQSEKGFLQPGVEGSLEQQKSVIQVIRQFASTKINKKTETSPSKSISYSCAMDNISSPSLASTDLIRLLFESLKWTLILDYQFDSENWWVVCESDRSITVYDEAREAKI